ncbi:hypothetical protein WKH56_07560 [Priestia sp. SB1]|uniref:Uncharacterized protein n=1 Tax=Priestia aryabhattai TaxID=412384 RepID=A0AAX6NE77_PRIAR|nr:hypothetical protein [Priestia aryabhattai]MDU9694208.1 hypothetical protein [Priestia aryabhattai]
MDTVMDAILQVGLIVVSIIGIVFLLISTFLMFLLTAMALRLNKFLKKQKALLDVVGKFSTYTNLFKKKG